MLELFWLSLRNRCEGGQRMSRQVVEKTVNWSKQQKTVVCIIVVVTAEMEMKKRDQIQGLFSE